MQSRPDQRLCIQKDAAMYLKVRVRCFEEEPTTSV